MADQSQRSGQAPQPPSAPQPQILPPSSTDPAPLHATVGRSTFEVMHGKVLLTSVGKAESGELVVLPDSEGAAFGPNYLKRLGDANLAEKLKKEREAAAAKEQY